MITQGSYIYALDGNIIVDGAVDQITKRDDCTLVHFRQFNKEYVRHIEDCYKTIQEADVARLRKYEASKIKQKEHNMSNKVPAKKETTFELLNKFWELSMEYKDYVESDDPDMLEAANDIGEELVRVEKQVTQKIENIKDLQTTFKGYRESISARQQVLKDEIKRLEGKKEGLDNAWRRVERLAIGAIKTTGKPNKQGNPIVRSDVGTFYIRKIPKVEILEEGDIPTKFIKEKRTYRPDKNKIKKALKDGEDISGANLVWSESLGVR